MDFRRLNTAEVLASGILNKPVPLSRQPDDARLTKVDEEDCGEDALRAGLQGGGLKASMYYGCWSIWKAGDGFDGELFQYRAVTDSFSGATLDEATEKAGEWAALCYG